MKMILFFLGLLFIGCTSEKITTENQPIDPPLSEVDTTKKELSDLFTAEVYREYDRIIPSENDYNNIIYIDPDYSGDSDGSFDRPFKTFNDAPQRSNTAYLFKRGTSYVVSSGHYRFNGENVLLGAYGEGDRPVIEAEGKGGIIFPKNNIVVRDIEVSYLQFGVINEQGTGGTVFNVKMRSIWIWSRNIKILGSEIKGASRNGIFIQQLDLSADNYIEIGYSHIHRVNQKWTPTTNQHEAPGDGIQISAFRGKYHIHNNIVDRSDTGNKFTIIVNAHHNGVNPVNGIIENCYLYGPMPQPDGGSILYFGNVIGGDQNNHHFVKIRNNFMKGSTYDGGKYTGAAVFSNSSKFEIYNNVIKNVANPLMLGNEAFGKNIVFDNTIIPL